jgi:hypothetical protein
LIFVRAQNLTRTARERADAQEDARPRQSGAVRNETASGTGRRLGPEGWFEVFLTGARAAKEARRTKARAEARAKRYADTEAFSPRPFNVVRSLTNTTLFLQRQQADAIFMQSA